MIDVRYHTYLELAKILASTLEPERKNLKEFGISNLPHPGNDWKQNPPPQFPMPWASSWGEDQFGIWCALEVKGVSQKMRWIPPGEFEMGSPDDEPEREDNEQLHKVVLMEGYWLADTACTQELWKAVMGSNPSNFRGENLPVEQVGYYDAVDFCKKINQLFEELHARLPSEAEWEYACRAGTQSAFWWGNVLNTKLANYDSENPYNKGPSRKWMPATLPVDSFFPNPWGLYQVHGNIYEWCKYWKEGDKEPSVINPSTYELDKERSLRGGSWVVRGSWLRSAYNGHGFYDDYDDFIGFRLASGLPQAEPSSSSRAL